MKRFLGIVLGVILVTGGLWVSSNSAKETPENMDNFFYSAVQIDTEVSIRGNPNVRSTPVLAEDKNTTSTNSWGRMEKCNFSISRYFVCENHADPDPNGPWIGFEIINLSDEALESFPDLSNDKDGIVWVSKQYLTLRNAQ